MIAVQNHSTVSTDVEIRAATRACAIQLTRDCAPAWNLAPVPVQFFAKGATIPAGAWPILIFDDADQQGVLGWHSDGPTGPYGRVFARVCKQFGVSVSSVLSHEVCEAFADPHITRVSADGWPIEIGDPVEADSYNIALIGAAVPPAEEDEYARRKPAPKTLVEVSDFALPAFYVKGSKGPWDFLQLTTGPYKLRPGGYAVTPSGTIYAEHYPEWRKLVKITDGSRTLRVAPLSDLRALGRTA